MGEETGWAAGLMLGAVKVVDVGRGNGTKREYRILVWLILRVQVLFVIFWLFIYILFYTHTHTFTYTNAHSLTPSHTLFCQSFCLPTCFNIVPGIITGTMTANTLALQLGIRHLNALRSFEFELETLGDS